MRNIGIACECCASWILNRDESACRDFYGHTEHITAEPDGTVVEIDSRDSRIGDCYYCDRGLGEFQSSYEVVSFE